MPYDNGGMSAQDASSLYMDRLQRRIGTLTSRIKDLEAQNELLQGFIERVQDSKSHLSDEARELLNAVRY